MRPAEVDFLVGNAAKAHEKLGWSKTVDFVGLVEMMVDSDVDLISRQVS
jgi:GDPmannose 4,6-dehydratase